MRSLALLALLAPALAATPAAAESGRLADFSIALGSRSPGTASGITVHAQFHRAGDPDAKPAPLRSAVIVLPPGLRIDSAALPRCTASDEELRAQGSDACPGDTELTLGKLVGTTGFGAPVDPLVGDDHVFNGPDQLIEVITFPGSSQSPAFDRLSIRGTTLTAHPPMLPGGPPDGETAVRSIDFAIPVRTGAAGRTLFTTPPSCSAGGRWTSTGTFRFGDGSSDMVSSLTPCEAAEAARPALRLSVRPRHVRAETVARLRFRVASGDARCVRGARVRLAGRSARVSGSGRARLAIRFRATGLRRAVVTKAGCRPAGAHVRVLRGSASRRGRTAAG